MDPAVLAARLVLPPQLPYARYLPARPDALPALEHARRAALASPALLPHVQVAPEPCLYLFSLSPDPSSVICTLDGLSLAESASFAPPPASSILPDPGTQALLAHFFQALRARLIDRIVAASESHAASHRRLRRFKDGILMGHVAETSDWAYKSITRPLILCDLELHFAYGPDGSPSHLLVHPILSPTPFLYIPPSLPPATPISLLPYATPAYFLATYSGPTSALLAQFQSSLHGLGVGSWDPSFVIAWITVENKQGEDKGITIIYPANLCLSYIPSSASRPPLHYIPRLPPQLQPSPSSSDDHPYRPSVLASPTSDSLHSFRALTVSKLKDLQSVATEVGSYVDAVLREREQERERLKRERETASPKITRATPASAPTPVSVADPPALASSPQALPPPPSDQAARPIQSFYPSPPHIIPASSVPDGKTSPVIDVTPANVEHQPDQHHHPSPPPPPQPIASSSTASFDPYSMDSAWAQSSYLDVNMDFGMDDMDINFDINNTSSSSAAPGGPTYAPENSAGGINMEFEDAFTDDDFSFFDGPSRPTPQTTTATTTETSHRSRAPNLILPTGITPPHFGDLHLSGPGPPSASAPQQTWTPGGLTDGFTPHSMDPHHLDFVPPDVAPWSPAHQTHTPETTPGNLDSAPVTPKPSVHLEHNPPAGGAGFLSGHHAHPNNFEPIPFGDYHRKADGKYSVGKFAFSLPSPPAEEETSFVSPVAAQAGWRLRYDAATDPRIQLVKKLAGVKRKIPFASEHNRFTKEPRIAWGDDDWVGDRTEEEREVEVDSEEEEEDEADDDDDETDGFNPPRPCTPPPPYLPLGPTLLHTQFQHAQLLPLCVSLRPPEAAVAPINLNLNASHPPPSVPTPVSPAATMGAATERSKSLEAAAFAVAAEVVENPIWAECWRANVVGAGTESRVWSGDVKAVGKFLENAGTELETPSDMTLLFALDKTKVLQPLEDPMLSIAKGDVVVQMKPPALRFWDKLGLNPKGGRKSLSAFVIFEDSVGRGLQVEKWIQSVQNVYQRRHYGTMSYGESNLCTSEGLLPLRYDATFRKSLANFIASLTGPQPAVVIFMVLPVTVMSLSSPVLRQVLSVSKKVLSTYTGGQIFYQFIPESHIFCSLEKDSAFDSALDQLCASVYNRTLVPVDRLRSRDVHHLEDVDNARRLFMAPSFTLARQIPCQVSYVRAAHTSLDVLDRFTLLHVAYHLTSCGKWVMACCVDQRGEAYDLKVWLTQGPRVHHDRMENIEEVHDPDVGHEQECESLDLSDEEYAIKKVWDFGMEFAKKGNVEWRVVFARLGVMSEKEINAWSSLLSDAVANHKGQPPLHHSVVCVVPDAPWLFIPTKSGESPLPIPRPAPPSRSSSSKQASVFADISSTAYAVFPSNRISVSLSPSQRDLNLTQSFIPEPPVQSSSLSESLALARGQISASSSTTSPITFLPQASAILINLPHTSSSDSISMIHIHLLRTVHSASYVHSSQALTSARVPGDQQLLQDVTRNFHELAVLSRVRWKLDKATGKTGLPFHVAAVDAMRVALESEWDRCEGGLDP